MSLKARPRLSNQTPNTDTDTSPTSPISPLPSPAPSFPQRALSQALVSTAQLANLLPTGTLLAFQFLMPIVTNKGSCDSATHTITLVMLLVLAGSCFLACFTDSFTSNGHVYYGFVTTKGMWIFDNQAAAASPSGLPDLSKYRLSYIDGVHAVLSVLVFIAVALKDKNVLSCFYPLPAHETREVLDIVPICIGFMCSLMFMIFPTRRHGIGYPVSSGGAPSVAITPKKL